jgi:hypothetical protein
MCLYCQVSTTNQQRNTKTYVWKLIVYWYLPALHGLYPEISFGATTAENGTVWCIYSIDQTSFIW